MSQPILPYGRQTIDDDDIDPTAKRVEELMGKKPEHRFNFIQEQTAQRGDKLLNELDV